MNSRWHRDVIANVPQSVVAEDIELSTLNPDACFGDAFISWGKSAENVLFLLCDF